MRRLPFFAVTVLAAAALSACTALGPDYHGPRNALPTAAQFSRATPATVGDAPLARWWDTLHDAQLNQLIERALQANPNLAVAQARLRHARVGVELERANRLPTASASAMAAKIQIPEINLGDQTIAAQWQSLYSLSGNASWEADLFGSHTRSVQASSANAQAIEANLADVQLSLTADVAHSYVALRNAQNRLAFSQAAIERQEKMRTLMQQRFEGGTASRLDVSKLTTQLDQTRAELPAQQADIDSQRNTLAVLLGQAPGSLDAELGSTGDIPQPPAEVAVGDPASLLQRRPDVRAAERTLAARTAQIGVAEAARFPQLKFTGMLGMGGTALSDLGKLNPIVALMPQLSWNFLDFGRNAARISQAEAQRDEAEAQYRSKVLGALQDAENALSRFGHRRLALAHSARAKLAADESATLTAQRQRGGTVSILELLDAERQQLQAQQNLLAALAGLTVDFITLQKALGLGWQAPQEPSTASPESAARAAAAPQNT